MSGRAKVKKRKGQPARLKAKENKGWAKRKKAVLSTKPTCPECSQETTFHSNHIFSQHYYCPRCKRFVRVPRREGFFKREESYKKNPFKPDEKP